MDHFVKIGSPAERRTVRDFLNKVRVDNVMAGNVVCVGEYDRFSEVEEKFRMHGIRHLPVVGQGGKLVGMISQRDLFRVCPPRVDEDGRRFYTKANLDEYILRHVMVRDPLTLKPEDSLADAFFKMAETHFGSVVVIDDHQRVCGIITRTDIIKAAVRILKE